MIRPLAPRRRWIGIGYIVLCRRCGVPFSWANSGEWGPDGDVLDTPSACRLE